MALVNPHILLFTFTLVFFFSFDVECWDNVNNGPLKKEKFLQLIKGKFGVYTSTSEPVDEDVIAAGGKNFKIINHQGMHFKDI